MDIELVLENAEAVIRSSNATDCKAFPRTLDWIDDVVKTFCLIASRHNVCETFMTPKVIKM